MAYILIMNCALSYSKKQKVCCLGSDVKKTQPLIHLGMARVGDISVEYVASNIFIALCLGEGYYHAEHHRWL